MPAIFHGTHEDPLRALVDAFSYTAATFKPHRQRLIAESKLASRVTAAL